MTPALVYGPQNFSASYRGSASFGSATSATVKVAVDYRLGPMRRVNVIAPGPQRNPSVSRLANGDAVAVYDGQDALGGTYIRARRLQAADGAPTGAEIVVARLGAVAGAGLGAAKIAGLSNGDFVVLWHVDQAGAGRDVWLRRYAPDGTPRDVAQQVNVTTTGDQSFPVVTAHSTGFVAAWQTEGLDGSGYGVVARRYGNDGVAQGQEQAVNTRVAGDQTAPSIATLANDSIVIAWSGATVTGFAGFFQRFDVNGAKIGAETKFTSSVPSSPVIATGPLPAGHLVAWSQPETANPTMNDLFLQLYDNAGVKSGALRRLDVVKGEMQTDPAMTPLDNGRSAFAWTTPDNDRDGINGQALDALNVVVPARPFQVNAVGLGRQRFPAIASLGAGADAGKRYVVLWSSQNALGTSEGVYAQTFVAP